VTPVPPLVHTLHAVAFWLVIACWVGFAMAFLFRRPSADAKTTQRASVSVLGIGLQSVAYAIAWILERRPRFGPIVPLPGDWGALPALLAIVLIVVSLGFAVFAVRTLGREWSYAARLVEGHRLVTAGPYAVVRHPIYSAMLGMLVASALVVSHWIGLVAAVIVFAIGTAIRVRSEERLLRGQFGADHDAYARRVPAFIPFAPR
jgi:protein-S-isoprenylcysteine O-methyltransferase Ste14